jgi:endonuclease/exonuclease/phosphatase family metal-dependent hydrolase
LMHELREHLRELEADIVFLQEVVGQHDGYARRFPGWPAEPQHQFIAGGLWKDVAYGRNAIHQHGHHGNAILSRYDIESYENQNISRGVFDRRGILHCIVKLPGDVRLHCLCVHLALTERRRRYQLGALVERVHALVPPQDPLVIAGDFNDWRNYASRHLKDTLGVIEAFDHHHGKSARSFPVEAPLLRLDRIYLRGFAVVDARVHRGNPGSRVSDHAALSAEVHVLECAT